VEGRESEKCFLKRYKKKKRGLMGGRANDAPLAFFSIYHWSIMTWLATNSQLFSKIYCDNRI
jgi:hypothetical protein